MTSLFKKWGLAFKVMPILALVLAIKLVTHYYAIEPLSLNQLFSSLIAATVFLLGFLISGVLSDYKESEKLPIELAASLETIHDEGYIINKVKKHPSAKKLMEHTLKLSKSLLTWFHKNEKTNSILKKISDFNDIFADLEQVAQPNFISRLKTEQNNMRKIVIRINAIRDTEFVSSAYAIAEALALFLITGLILVKIEPFHESLFFTGLVTFLIVYMILLIKDLDNPFDYKEKNDTEGEISLYAIESIVKRLEEKTKNTTT